MRKWFLRKLGYVEVPVVDPITELKNAINRAMNIAKLHPEIRTICDQTAKMIDTFGFVDQSIYDGERITLPAIEAAPPTLKTGEVST